MLNWRHHWAAWSPILTKETTHFANVRVLFVVGVATATVNILLPIKYLPSGNADAQKNDPFLKIFNVK